MQWPWLKKKKPPEQATVIVVTFSENHIEYIFDRTTREMEDLRPGWHTFEVAEYGPFGRIFRQTRRLNLSMARTMGQRVMEVAE